MTDFNYNNPTESGWDRCVWCGVIFGSGDETEEPPGISGGLNHTYGPVYDTDGAKYGFVGDTEPGSDIMHKKCYMEYRGEDSKELTEFVE